MISYIFTEYQVFFPAFFPLLTLSSNGQEMPVMQARAVNR